MSLGYYGVLIIFAAFFLLLIFSPREIRQRKSTSEGEPSVVDSRTKRESEPRKKKLKTQDYGFSLIDDDEKEESIK
jgi:hypothetical protein